MKLDKQETGLVLQITMYYNYPTFSKQVITQVRTAAEGQVVYDAGTNGLKVYNGTGWADMGGAGGGLVEGQAYRINVVDSGSTIFNTDTSTFTGNITGNVTGNITFNRNLHLMIYL